MDDENFEGKISWFDKLLLIICPNAAIRRIGRRMGIEDSPFVEAHLLFEGVRRVDILPLAEEAGFMLVLDRNTALYFYRNGDGFEYDGFEIGEYLKSDIAIFERSP